MIHSDDGSCTWTAATGSLSDVLPYAVAVDPTGRFAYAANFVALMPETGSRTFFAGIDKLVTEGEKFKETDQLRRDLADAGWQGSAA